MDYCGKVQKFMHYHLCRAIAGGKIKEEERDARAASAYGHWWALG
jgi:hypothetical protein